MTKQGFFHRIAILAVFLLPLAAGVSYAVDDDFGSSRVAESKHFTIHYPPQMDIAELARQLNVRPSDELIARDTPRTDILSAPQLTDMVDTLFMQVGDILDMHIYSFHGTIKICQDDAQIDRVYNSLFNKSLHHRKSFYVYGLNTIYISLDNFKQEILGHEMAHAIINHYFVVQSPVKIQEVLAMYVEFQLRKE